MMKTMDQLLPKPWRLFFAILLSMLLYCLVMGPMRLAAASEAEPLRIGSKRFTESYILAQLLAKSAAPQAVEIKQGLGNTAIVFAALQSRGIDLYPEYAGTIAQEILKSTKPLTIDEMNAALAPLGFAVAIPFGFNNGYALAMRAADADALGIKTLADLAKYPQQRLGLSNEFIGRQDGWKGLASQYSLPQLPISIDHGLAYDAIKKKQIDVMDIYTTDAKIVHLGLRVLADDRHYFPRYDAVVLYRLDVPTRFPEAWQTMQRLIGAITEPDMIAMNARAELEGVAFEAIAKDYLADSPRAMEGNGANVTNAAKVGKVADAAKATTSHSQSPSFSEKLLGDDFWRLTRQHVGLVLVSLLAAALISIPLAFFIFPHRRIRAFVLGAAGLLQTVPSLALLAVLISLIGVIGMVPALLALTLYALLPIMRNTCAGLAEVPEGLKQAGKALGMLPRDVRWQIELPLALPTIIAGIRTAAAITIGTATIAAFIGAGGYGERIVTGLALNDRALLLAGAIPAALLALISEAIFEWVEVILAHRAGRANLNSS